jgi:anti-anti-sigma factor
MSSGEAHFQVEIDDTAAPVRVVATGEVDAASAPLLAEAIATAVSNDDGPIVLDLGSVTFFDSSGLRAVTAAVSDAERTGQRVSVAVASDVVERIFTMTGLTSLLDP